MSINSITGAYAQQKLNKTSDSQTGMRRKGDDVPNRTGKKQADTVEISKEGMDRLSEVRRKMDAGFYNSEKVNEIISEKLSSVLDEMI